MLQTVCVAGTDGQIIKQIIKSGKLQIIIFSCNTSCMMETYNGSTNVANSLCCGELMVKLSRLADGAKHAIATLTTQTPMLGSHFVIVMNQYNRVQCNEKGYATLAIPPLTTPLNVMTNLIRTN